MKRVLIALVALALLPALASCNSFSHSAAAADRQETGLRTLRIAIDPGHGGIDNGAVGTDTGVTESELNLRISQLLAKRFLLAGSDVLLTRKTADVDYAGGEGNTQKRRDMNSRAKQVAAQVPLVLVSVHMNKYPGRSVSGAQVFYQKGSADGEALARSIQEALNAGLDGKDRSAKSGDYFMLKVSECPAVIVECGFLSNHNEEKMLADPGYQQKLANCIYKGICAYIGNTE